MSNQLGRLLVACLILLAGFPATATSGPTSELIQEERAVGLVRTVASGDADAVLAWMEANWVPARPGDDRERNWPRVAAALTERHAGVGIRQVEVRGDGELVVVAEDPDGMVLQFLFSFEPDPPHRITELSLEAGEGLPELDVPAPDLSGVTDTASLGEALEAWFAALAAEDVFAGTALVAGRGDVLFRGAWGLADRSWNAPSRLDTRFDVGSINKSFTQVAIARLAAAGRLSLDDTIARHLRDYPNRQAAAKVTIRHLLDHSSGLGDIFTDAFFEASKDRYREPRDYFPLFAGQPLHFEPGVQEMYSNAGYIVLGAIVEAVSGQPFDEHIQEQVFAPAGMRASGFFARDEIHPDVAMGYTRMGPGDGQTLRSNVFMLPVRGSAAGSAFCTVEDLWRFDEALREHRLLGPGWTRWYFGDGPPPPGATGTAPGARETASVGIAGGAPGVSACLESDGELAVIVLSNLDAPIAESVAITLYRALRPVLERLEP